MTLDLTMVVCSIVLAFVLVLVAATGKNMQAGKALAGNRDNDPVLTGWAGRAERAHRNLMENLPLFIGLALVAHIAGRANGIVILGTEIFVGARIVHALAYIGGIPWLRSLAWAVSVIGMIMIFVELL
jgi:uncharacterized MAPEG superfamily protein